MKKYTVQHVGHPTTSAIPRDAWHTLSEHASYNAACKAVDAALAGSEPGSWTDHYRILNPAGQVVSRDQYLQERASRDSLTRARKSWWR